MEQSELLRFVVSVLERLDIWSVNIRTLKATVAITQSRIAALLELREGNFDFLDNYGNKIPGRQRLFPSGTVLGGKRIPRA